MLTRRGRGRLVDGALQGDPDSDDAVQALMFYNVPAPGFHFPRAEPEVVDVSVSSPTFTVDRSTGEPRLVLQMRVEGSFNMRLDHKKYLYPFRKEVTYWLVPHLGKDASLIDGYEGRYSTDEPRRV